MRITTSHGIDREIMIMQKMIEQLQECLEIYHEQNQHKHFKATISDIQKCKKELKRLIAQKEAEKQAEKNVVRGETKNDAKHKQHRKTVL